MPTILVPPQDGSSLDAEEVFGVATMMRDRWPDCTFVLDPAAGGEQLAQRIDNELRSPVMTHSQQPGPMCRASQLLSETIASRQLEHPDDAALNRHVLAAGAKFVGASWRLAKQRGKSLPIDAVIALAIGLRVLSHANQRTTADDGVIVPDRALYWRLKGTERCPT